MNCATTDERRSGVAKLTLVNALDDYATLEGNEKSCLRSSLLLYHSKNKIHKKMLFYGCQCDIMN